jgi:hypothetical protein
MRMLTLNYAIHTTKESGLDRAEAELLDDDLSLHNELWNKNKIQDSRFKKRVDGPSW